MWRVARTTSKTHPFHAVRFASKAEMARGRPRCIRGAKWFKMRAGAQKWVDKLNLVEAEYEMAD